MQKFSCTKSKGIHLPPIRVVIIKKSTNSKWWTGCGKKGTLLHCCWEYKLVQPLKRIVLRFLKKLKVPYDSLLSTYLEKLKTNLKGYMHPSVRSSSYLPQWRHGKNPSAHQQMTALRKCYIYICNIYIYMYITHICICLPYVCVYISQIYISPICVCVYISHILFSDKKE